MDYKEYIKLMPHEIIKIVTDKHKHGFSDGLWFLYASSLRGPDMEQFVIIKCLFQGFLRGTCNCGTDHSDFERRIIELVETREEYIESKNTFKFLTKEIYKSKNTAIGHYLIHVNQGLDVIKTLGGEVEAIAIRLINITNLMRFHRDSCFFLKKIEENIDGIYKILKSQS